MSNTSHDSSRQGPPNTPQMGTPFLECDLTREVERLRRGNEWKGGQNAKTLVKYDDLRLTLIALEAGAALPVHQTKGRISIQTIMGHILVRAEGRTFDLPAGTLLALDQNLPHDVEALEESAFLLTMVWPGGDRQPVP